MASAAWLQQLGFSKMTQAFAGLASREGRQYIAAETKVKAKASAVAFCKWSWRHPAAFTHWTAQL